MDLHAWPPEVFRRLSVEAQLVVDALEGTLTQHAIDVLVRRAQELLGSDSAHSEALLMSILGHVGTHAAAQAPDTREVVSPETRPLVPPVASEGLDSGGGRPASTSSTQVEASSSWLKHWYTVLDTRSVPIHALALEQLELLPTIVAAGARGRVWILGERDGAPIELPGHFRPVTAAAIASLRGRDMVVTADAGGLIQSWLHHGQRGSVAEGTNLPISAGIAIRDSDLAALVFVSHDGTLVTVDHAGAVARRWQSQDGAALHDVLAFEAPDSSGLVVAGKAGLFLLSELGEVRASMSPPSTRSAILSLALGSGDFRGRIFAGLGDGSLASWTPRTDQTWQIDSLSGPVRALAAGRLGGRDILATAGDDGSLHVHTADMLRRGGRLTLRAHQGPVHALAIGRWKNHDVLLSAGQDGKVQAWTGV